MKKMMEEEGQNLLHIAQNSCLGTFAMAYNHLPLADKFDHISAVNRFGETVMHVAVAYNAVDIFKFVLENIDEEINRVKILAIQNNAQNTVLHKAAAKNSREFLQIIHDSITNLLYRSQLGHIKDHSNAMFLHLFTLNKISEEELESTFTLAVRFFTESELPQVMTQTEKENNNLLHVFVRLGCITIVKSILSWAADLKSSLIFAKNSQGMLPLHCAVRYKPDNSEMLKLLIECYPADQTQRIVSEIADESGNTVLHYTAHKGSVISIAITLCACPDKEALLQAMKKKNGTYNHSFQLKESNNDTVFHLATRNKYNRKVFELLFGAVLVVDGVLDALIHERNGNGVSVADYARQLDRDDISFSISNIQRVQMQTY